VAVCSLLMCLFRLPDTLNTSSQMWHLYGFSPVWTLMWVFRCPDTLNASSHMWHLYGFSPVWTLMWLFRYPDQLNALSHMWHLYGFSPLWILLLCLARSVLLRKPLSHSVHLYLSVWIYLWILSAFCDEQRLPHSLHVYTLSSVCIRLWTFKYFFFVNRLSHTVRKYGLGLSSCSVISFVWISNGWDLSMLSASDSNSVEMPAYTQH